MNERRGEESTHSRSCDSSAGSSLRVTCLADDEGLGKGKGDGRLVLASHDFVAVVFEKAHVNKCK